MTASPRLLALLLLCASLVRADNWPAWRGANGSGHTNEKDLPTEWGPDRNVKWKIPLPDQGNSTPVIWGDRVFYTQATERGKKRTLHCLDRATGKERWKVEVPYADKETTHGTNPYCSASPATDGERVIVSHGSAGLFCYDLEGKELWKRDFGKQDHIWGNASSPVIWRDFVFFYVGPGENTKLVALDRKTGKDRWEFVEKDGNFGKDNKEWRGSWSTPIIAKVGDRDELILSIPLMVKAFEPTTGKELWSCEGLTKLVYTSPIISPDGIVVAMSGYGGSALAVRAGGNGDVTKTHRLWHHPRAGNQRIGTGVILGDHCYMVNESGQGQRFDLKTGMDDWKNRRISSKTWSSLVLAGDKIYQMNDNAETLVLTTGAEPKELAKNSLNEMTRASIEVSDGELFIRTYKHLWCIGKK
jgi:outer membrane protein assembly factor BamB